MSASVRESAEVTVEANQWVVAAGELCRQLDDVDEWFGVVAERLIGVAEADLVSVVVRPAGAKTVAVAAVAGVDARHWRGMSVPSEGTLTGSVLDDGEPRRVENLAELLGDNVATISDVQSLLAIPLTVGDAVRAVLTIGRCTGRQRFTDTDLVLAVLFGGQLALALTHREERARLERAVLAGERDRIARSMQTNVIGRLFALGMRLQGAAGVASGPAARQLEAGSDEIDETIKAIRATVYRIAD